MMERTVKLTSGVMSMKQNKFCCIEGIFNEKEETAEWVESNEQAADLLTKVRVKDKEYKQIYIEKKEESTVVRESA